MILKSRPIAAAWFLSAAGGAAQAQDFAHRLINDTGRTLVEFYASDVENQSWEQDLLADSDLEPGAEATVAIADGGEQCEYDVLFGFEDGQELTDTVNICELNSYTLTQ